MPEPDFRAALQQLTDAVDGWEMEPAPDDPLLIAMDHARKVLKAAEEGERLSSGKLVSERIEELLSETEQRGLVPVNIVVGTRAEQLLRKEHIKFLILIRGSSIFSPFSSRPLPNVQDQLYLYGLAVIKDDSMTDEYVGISVEAVNM
jgi:hypothetical protein